MYQANLDEYRALTVLAIPPLMAKTHW